MVCYCVATSVPTTMPRIHNLLFLFARVAHHSSFTSLFNHCGCGLRGAPHLFCSAEVLGDAEEGLRPQGLRIVQVVAGVRGDEEEEGVPRRSAGELKRLQRGGVVGHQAVHQSGGERRARGVDATRSATGGRRRFTGRAEMPQNEDIVASSVIGRIGLSASSWRFAIPGATTGFNISVACQVAQEQQGRNAVVRPPWLRFFFKGAVYLNPVDWPGSRLVVRDLCKPVAMFFRASNSLSDGVRCSISPT
eukprot:11205178-Lingulodinium_polyedra.AAC.1